MITATRDGRRLVLTVETGDDEQAIAPFVVSPVSAAKGNELSSRFVFASEGLVDEATIADDMRDAFGHDNYQRAFEECTSEEGELLLNAAYFWQTVGGMDAVRALLEVDEHGDQGGAAGRGKAMAAFRLRVVPLLSRISRSLESELRTREAATPGTGTPDGGEQPDAPSSNDSNASTSRPETEPPTSTGSDSPAPNG